MNKVIFSGRLTAAPELRYLNNQDQTAVATYTLAVQRDYKGQNGDYTTDFFRCKAFGRQAEFAQKYLHKGMKIIVEGQMHTSTYKDKEGRKAYATDCIVSRHEFCESKTGGASAGSGSSYQQGQQQRQPRQPQGEPDFPEAFTSCMDDVPF